MSEESQNSASVPTVLAVGSGAVGSLYGGKLAQSGFTVDFLCRSDFKAVKEHGIAVQSIWGDFRVQPRNVYNYENPPTEEYDFILVTLKVLPEIDLPAILKDVVSPGSSIILLQNGIDIEKAVADAFPENEIISGLAFVCVSRLAPGRVHHIDYGRLVLGLYPGGESKRVQVLTDAFHRVGVKCQSSSDVIAARWQKLVWNAPFNPISVLTGGADTAQMVATAENLALIRAVMEEVFELARADGHELSEDIIDKNIENTQVMQPYKTSMLLDYEAGRPLESEAILGNAIRLAERVGVAVPRLRELYALLTTADLVNSHKR